MPEVMSIREGVIRQGTAAFEPRARLLKLIGAELISDDVLAVTELVKNAHDADATGVWIDFAGVRGPEGTITVRDDGDGMALEDLLNRWMQPAGTFKARQRYRRTRSGRRVLGEKGVGRFAADKLASRLELVSRARRSGQEIRAVFDWDAFDSRDASLADIKTSWEVRRPRELKGHGTILRLTGLRSTWTERMFRRLSARLARLRPPVDPAGSSFGIWINSDEFPDYSGQVSQDFLDRAPYRIEASFDGQDTIQVALNGSPAQSHPWNGDGALQCGPVRLRLFGFDLESQSLSRLGPPMTVRGWLREWSGISLYRDGFRVWPYGEPHDDWLRLDQRRVNNPTVRLSNNQVVGFVEIGRDSNPDLVDQTNREGLIHNGAYEDLRRIVHFVLQILEAERQNQRHPEAARRIPTGKGSPASPTGSAAGLLTQLSAQVAGAPRSRQLLKALMDALEQDQSRQLRLRRSYADLAALGQSALQLSSATRPMLEELRLACTALQQRVNGHDPEGRIGEMLGAIDSLSTRLAPLHSMDAASGYRSRHTDVGAELDVFQTAVQSILASRGTKLSIRVHADRALLVPMRPETLHRVLHILLTNSLDWLHRVRHPQVSIAVKDLDESCEILFSDNGPGVSTQLRHRVFEPEVSGREGGRGMGLTLARDILERHRGTIELVSEGRQGGATFKMTLVARRRRKSHSP